MLSIVAVSAIPFYIAVTVVSRLLVQHEGTARLSWHV